MTAMFPIYIAVGLLSSVLIGAICVHFACNGKESLSQIMLLILIILGEIYFVFKCGQFNKTQIMAAYRIIERNNSLIFMIISICYAAFIFFLSSLQN